MGFSEEPGIIPRFCEDLFAEIAKKQTEEVCSHGLCKSSYSSREQADRVKVRAEATGADSADGMLWPFPLGPEGERVQTQAVPPGGQRRRGFPAGFSASSALPPVRVVGRVRWPCPVMRVCSRGPRTSRRTAGSVLCRQQQEAGERPARLAQGWPQPLAPAPSRPRVSGRGQSQALTCPYGTEGSTRAALGETHLQREGRGGSQQCARRWAVPPVPGSAQEGSSHCEGT